MSRAYQPGSTSRHRSTPLVSLADDPSRAQRTQQVVDLLRDAPTPQDRQELARQLVVVNRGVARSVASRYRRRGLDADDLEQVALLGLVKAAQRFDPHSGHDFLSFAVPTMRGELRRHFRDAGWMVRPPRRIQELRARIASSREELEAGLGRSARPSEVAGHLGEPLADVVEALAADGCFAPSSLDLEVGDGTATVGDLIGGEDAALTAVDARLGLVPALRMLSDRDRSMLRMRFGDDLTQQEIAEAVGITQAQVSRVLSRVLATLRDELDDGPDRPDGPQPAPAPAA